MIVLLLGGGGGTWWLMQNDAAGGRAPYARESFLAMLRESGIQIDKAAGTNTYAWLKVPQESELGIWTDKGSVDVFFFPTQLKALSRSNKPGSTRGHWGDSIQARTQRR